MAKPKRCQAGLLRCWQLLCRLLETRLAAKLPAAGGEVAGGEVASKWSWTPQFPRQSLTTQVPSPPMAGCSGIERPFPAEALHQVDAHCLCECE